jgi:hypothetical protein
LCSFIQRFSQVHNIIPRISNASIVVAFRQGVRDEKMLKKLTTHDIQDVAELFSQVDKCVMAAEGHAWHSPPAPEVGRGVKPDASAAAQGGSSKNKNKKKKKVSGNNHLLAGAPTVVAAAAVAAGVGRGPQGDKHPVKHLAVIMEACVAQCTTLHATALRSAGKS